MDNNPKGGEKRFFPATENNVEKGEDEITYMPTATHHADFLNGNGQEVYIAPPPSPKKLLRKTANAAFSGPLLFFCCSFIYSVIIGIISAVFALNSEDAYNTFYDFVSTAKFNLIMNSFLQAIFMTVPYIIACTISKQKASDILRYKIPKKGTALPVIIIGLGGAMLANLANSIIYSLFSFFGSPPQGSGLVIDNSLSSLFFNIVTIAVIPALFEEFAFRGMMMGILKKRVSTSAAIVISATAFGLIHGNFSQMPFAFLVGLVLGYAYAVTDSLWVPMAIHFLNNGYSVVMDFVAANTKGIYASILLTSTLAVILLAGIIAFALLVKKKDDAFEIAEEQKELSVRQEILTGISSPVAIIVIVIFSFEAIALQFLGI